jgi:ABC transporter substrate binding protein (PQQ-dependent alcohol dehydrogenase system)
MVPNTLAALIGLFLVSVNVAAVAQEAAPQPKPARTAKPVTEIKIGYLRAYEPTLALSVLDVPPKDLGIAGATVAMADNNTTGSFMGQKFTLEVTDVEFEADVVPIFDEMLAQGEKYVLTDLSEKQLLSIADKARDAGVLLFNVGNTDDSLREENCRINVFHTAPTRSMLADGLAQYLIWKQWPKWVLISGSHEKDKLFAAALKRAAERFGGQIVAEKEFKDTGTSKQTDSGVVQIQKQMPVFTQDLPDHDVLLVADESEVFGSYLPFRTWVPRPVAGTAGMIPSIVAPGLGTMGRRADSEPLRESDFGRRMMSKDMNAWTAGRIIGEAATRTQGDDSTKIEEFIRSDKFSVAAFRGQKVTFRKWNWQLRQPVFLGDGRGVITTSPQEGFLHQISELDTLGVDQPETKCTPK